MYRLPMSSAKYAAAVIMIAAAFTIKGSAQAPYFDDAFANAAKPSMISAGWVVTAKVYIKAANGEYISAVGPVRLAEDKTLGGELPMSINNSPVANNTIGIHIRKSDPAVVIVNRNVAGKPFLGRGGAMTSLKVDPNFNYLNGPIKWNGGNASIQIFLESEFVRKKADNSGSGQNTSNKTTRYQIGGFMRVTNSSDGVLDNTVEIYGTLWLHQYRKNGVEVGKARKLIEVVEQDANNGFQMDFNKLFIDAEDGDTLTLEGGFQDRDAGQGLTGDDPMFNGNSCMNKFGVYNLFRFTNRDGSMLCKGDQNSESADIRIWAKKVE